jgi:phospholipid/cholesterol/gamma-HCH transport system ATP-binding protein
MRGGVEVRVQDLQKSFGGSLIFSGLTFTLPPGEISVLLGPSGTGKSVFLKCLLGLLRPDKGSILLDGMDIVGMSEENLNQMRKRFGVLFQGGALFGSMTLYDNIAYPLREHTKKNEHEIRDIVMDKVGLMGLAGHEHKLPGDLSGGMRKRAGLARALVLDPSIVVLDEPDSGLDPVRTAYLNQLIVELNAVTDATFLIVTHNIRTAQTLPDNVGVMYHKHMAMFGPRELVLTSDEPVVAQFIHGRKDGPIGMNEQHDDQTSYEAQPLALPPLQPQLRPLNGLQRHAARRRWERLRGILDTLPEHTQQAIHTVDPDHQDDARSDTPGTELVLTR